MEISVATADQIDEIYKLICELEDQQLCKVDFNNSFLSNILNKDVYYFVAIQKGCIIGFISLHVQCLLHHTSKIAEIQELIVSEQSQAKGVGHMLFEKAKEVAIENNCLQLEVCCNIKRITSHEFYKRQGMANNHYKFCLPL